MRHFTREQLDRAFNPKTIVVVGAKRELVGALAVGRIGDHRVALDVGDHVLPPAEVNDRAHGSCPPRAYPWISPLALP